MQTSKLIKILQKLSKQELHKFVDLVRSPFFNKNEQITQLLDILLPFYPNFEQLTRSYVIKELFGKQMEDDKKLRYVMSNLTKLAEQFLAQQEFQKHELQQNHLLLRVYHQKNLLEFAKPKIDRSRQLLAKAQYKDDNFYFENFLIEKDFYEYIATKRNLAVKENLQNTLQNLDYFYYIYKLKLSAEMVTQTEALAVDYDPLIIKEIINYLDHTQREEVPAINIYYEIMQMLTAQSSETHYFKLKALLEEHSNKFPREEVNDMYIFARNYCAQKINSGESEYLSEIFDLYKSLLKKEILLINGYLSQWDYKNIVAVGLRIEAFDWVKDFIYNHRDKLKPEHRENAFTYNLANYYYYSGKLEKTMELLHDVDFTDVFYNLDCKVLLMKTYYERQEIDPLHSLMDSFYMYLRRNKLISEFQRNSYQNFLKMLKKIIRLKPGDNQKKDALLKELEETHPLANVSWLKKKVAELN